MTFNISRASDGPLADLGGPAHDLWRRVTAPDRHAQRVQATLDVARSFVASLGSPDDDVSDKRPMLAFAILADIIGCGGVHKLGGSSQGTSRLPFFQQLGKGRWLANDGSAYRAAAWEAFHSLAPEGLTIGTVDDRLVISLGDNSVLLDTRGALWASPVLGRLLLRALGTSWDEDALRSPWGIPVVSGQPYPVAMARLYEASLVAEPTPVSTPVNDGL